MGLIELFVLAVGLSMDAFAVAVCKGLSLGKINKKHMLITGAWFGGFQGLMPLIGYLFGSLFADTITQFDHWIAFALLLFLGGKMVKESFSQDECLDCCMSIRTMFLLAVATSIDALAVGITFAFLKVSIIPAVSFIGVITFVCSAIGIKVGSIFGQKYKSKAELFGGIVLILIGSKILLEGVGLI